MFAAVVAARKTGLAGVARDVRLDSDAVAGLEVLDGGVHGEDLRGSVVDPTGNVVEGKIPLRQIHGQECVCLRRS